MLETAKTIQNTAKKLLEEKKVDIVLGFADGSLPLRSTPIFVRKPEDAEKLTWNYSCETNLANYLRNKEERIAVIVKGCDSRSIVALIKENQINRDNLYIIGVPCSGMVDRKKVIGILGGKELLAVEENGDSLVLKGRDISETVKLSDLIHESCVACNHKNPVISDEMVGEIVTENTADDFSEIEAFESKSSAERRDHLVQELSKCIRCYACRNACPMCYCEECFVDCSTPEWIGKSALNVQDNLLFQAVRVFHLAGRCTDCGACERACPMGVDLSLLTRKMVKNTKELFGSDAGVNMDDKPALITFNPDDPQPFLDKE